jgi:hypothetical protein
MYPTLTDYILKARTDFKNKKNSSNDEYMTAFNQKPPFKKSISVKLYKLLKNNF